MKLRQHQIECINKIDEHLKKQCNGLIKMFCGSGKSFVIYHCLLKYIINLSVLVVPSINLITQFNKDYLLNESMQKYNSEHFKKEFRLLTICSKNELNNKFLKNLNFSTNENEILKFLENNTIKIILVTYQSLKILFNVIRKNDVKIDFLCFDEAHHILGDETKNLLFETDIENEYESNEFCKNFVDTYASKILYFTATPKNNKLITMYEPVSGITINGDEFEIIDDENLYYCREPHCGKMIYEYTHKNGVNDNILNDFKIRIDLYTEDTDKSVLESISRSILESENNRVLTFHSRSETNSEKGSNVANFVTKKTNLSNVSIL